MKSNEFFYGQIGHESGPASNKPNPDNIIVFVAVVIVLTIAIFLIYGIKEY